MKKKLESFYGKARVHRTVFYLFQLAVEYLDLAFEGFLPLCRLVFSESHKRQTNSR